MKSKKDEQIDKILDNYVHGHINREQMQAMIEAVEQNLQTHYRGGNTMSNKDIRSKWRESETRPGYLVRTATRSGVTANVYKPIPTAKGKTQRELAKAAKAARQVGPVIGREQTAPLVYMRVGNKNQLS